MQIRKKMKSTQDLELAQPPKSIAKADALTKQIVKMNYKGVNPDKIADELGMHPTKVRMMIQEHVCTPERLEALNDTGMQRATQAFRMEQLIESRMETALAGDNSDAELVRKVMSDQNKLLGVTERMTQEIKVSGAIEHSVDVSGEVTVTHDFSKAQANLDKYINRKEETKELPPNTHKPKRDVPKLLDTLDPLTNTDNNDDDIIDAEIIEDDTDV